MYCFLRVGPSSGPQCSPLLREASANVPFDQQTVNLLRGVSKPATEEYDAQSSSQSLRFWNVQLVLPIAAIISARSWQPRLCAPHAKARKTSRNSRIPRAGAARPHTKKPPPRPPPRPPLPKLDPWIVLGIPRRSSASEIRSAFRSVIRSGAHPDQGGDPEKFLQLRIAYDEALVIANDPNSVVSSVPEGTGTAPSGADEETGEEEDEDEDAPRKTLDDFLRFRAEARERRAVTTELRRRKAERHAASSGTAKPKRMTRLERIEVQREPMSKDLAYKKTIYAIHEAPTKQSQEAWSRELEGEGVAAFIAATSSLAVKAAAHEAKFGPDVSETNATVPTERIVGHRSVRAASGQLRVPVYEDSEGNRHYVSPLTGKRVALFK